MTSTCSMTLRPRSDRPVDAATIALVRAVGAVAAGLGLPMLLVGATARIVLLEHVHGLTTGLGTRDIDFAFAVSDWPTFDALKRALIASGPFAASRDAAHRLYYRPPSGESGTIVDLIPFGGVEGPGGALAWPPDLDVVMSVVGFHDAHEAAADVEIAPGLLVRVASLPGIALLKLFAWRDRGLINAKDALDLHMLLHRYGETGVDTRLYHEALDRFEALDYDLELAAAWLLGRDAATLAGPDTRTQALAILTNTTACERLINDMARTSGDGAIDPLRRLLDQFVSGFLALA